MRAAEKPESPSSGSSACLSALPNAEPVREYAVVFARSAQRELQALDRVVAGRILKRIEALSREPRPPGCKKLEGTDNLWRIRVGDWRVVSAIHDARRGHPSSPRRLPVAWPLTTVGTAGMRITVRRE